MAATMPAPDPDPANHAFSHTCDAARYLCWTLRRMFGLRMTERDSEENPATVSGLADEQGARNYLTSAALSGVDAELGPKWD